MERIKSELGTGFCRMCDYCQPCLQNIRISWVMNIQSFFKRFAPERIYKGPINDNMNKVALSYCEDCGKYESRCPYDLPIREKMKEATDFFFADKKDAHRA